MTRASPSLAFKSEFHAVESDGFEDLALIYEKNVNICISRRPISESASSFVSRLFLAARDIEITSQIQTERTSSMSTYLPREILEIPGARDWVKDLEFLVELFTDLLGSKRLGLRIRTLDKPMCPRFHVDRVPVRMICTYGAPGTEWLPEHSVDRRWLGHASPDLPDELSGLVLDASEIQSVPTNAIALLKGELWEGNEGFGAVHRSPQLDLSKRRLLVTLDML